MKFLIYQEAKCSSDLQPESKLFGMIKNEVLGTSLVVQWLRMRLSMQATQVPSLVQEDPTCHRATKPVRHNYWAWALEPASHNYWAHAPQLLKPESHNYWAHVPRACALQQEKPQQWEARAPQWRPNAAKKKKKKFLIYQEVKCSSDLQPESKLFITRWHCTG